MFHCPVEVWVIEQRAIILSATVRSPTVWFSPKMEPYFFVDAVVYYMGHTIFVHFLKTCELPHFTSYIIQMTPCIWNIIPSKVIRVIYCTDIDSVGSHM